MTHVALQLPDDETLALIVQKAERAIGCEFNDKSYLIKALTHPSAVEEDTVGLSYERLEFLGDAFLGAVVAQIIYERFPNINEGVMTRLKSAVVSGSTLASLAEQMGFGDLIIFGESERGTGGRGLHSALENVYESVVAALLLDGGPRVAHEWIIRTLGPLVTLDMATRTVNPKSRLQEVLQEHGHAPVYETVAEDGPPHDRTFTVEVRCDGKLLGTGSGRSKKEAEANAAQVALDAHAR